MQVLGDALRVTEQEKHVARVEMEIDFFGKLGWRIGQVRQRRKRIPIIRYGLQKCRTRHCLGAGLPKVTNCMSQSSA